MPRRNHRTKPAKHQVFKLNGNMICHKKSYPSEQAANWVAEDQMKYSFEVVIKSYYCPNCGKWHLTSRKD